jgi:uncharacterized protein YjiS (DUF1127 family)
MLLCTLVLVALSAGPRGLPASSAEDLVTQVDARLASWLKHAGDRQALLANAAELEAYLDDLGVSEKDREVVAATAKREQQERPAKTTLVAKTALLQVVKHHPVLRLFDDQGHCSAVTLFGIGGDRFVLLGGPDYEACTLAGFANDKHVGSLLAFEKGKKGWQAMPLPGALACSAVLERAAKYAYTSEKAYFAETDQYTDDLVWMGVVPRELDVTSVKVTLQGTGSTGSFSIDVSRGDGVVRIDAQGVVSVVKACTK